MKALNGILMTQIQMTFKDVYNVRKLHRPSRPMSDAS